MSPAQQLHAGCKRAVTPLPRTSTHAACLRRTAAPSTAAVQATHPAQEALERTQTSFCIPPRAVAHASAHAALLAPQKYNDMAEDDKKRYSAESAACVHAATRMLGSCPVRNSTDVTRALAATRRRRSKAVLLS